MDKIKTSESLRKGHVIILSRLNLQISEIKIRLKI